MSARGALGLERRLGTWDSLAVVYSLEDVLSDTVGRSYLTHFGSLQWNHVLSLRAAFLLEAGASYTPDAVLAGLDHQKSFFGGATFTRQLGRSRLIAYVRREVLPAFGLGVSFLETRVGVQADIPMGRAWRLSLLGYHARPDTSNTGEQLYSSSSNLFAALSRRLGARFALSGEARYRSRGQTTTLARINATEVGLYVLFVPPGRANVPSFDR